MASELSIDDNLIVKSYEIAQEEDVTKLAKCIESVINSNEEVQEQENSVQSEMEDAGLANVTFTVGDFVRCTYDDGIDYEAKILSVDSDNGTCRIKYAGYGNEQTVNMDALIASWGDEARRSQCATAMAEQTATTNASKKQKKTVPKNFNPPPVPPIPPMLFDSEDEEKNQQFAQLLISWFMTGYYTGLHQRTMQESKMSKK